MGGQRSDEPAPMPAPPAHMMSQEGRRGASPGEDAGHHPSLASSGTAQSREPEGRGCAPRRTAVRRGVCVGGVSPCPVGFKEGRVVDDGGEQGREAPQQQGGEELGDDGVLQRAEGGRMCQVGAV